MTRPARESSTADREFGLGVRLTILLAPFVYKFLMWIIFHTSRKTYVNLGPFWKLLNDGTNVLAAVWHQDAVISSFAYRGKKIVTMASHSKDGEIVARILERCGFIPFRGSSSAGGKEALNEIADFLHSRSGVMTGIAVDGPRGPAFVFKPGLLKLSMMTGASICPLRSWAKRHILLKNWDGTMLPLPFNHLVFLAGEPVVVPVDCSPAGFERLRADLELQLRGLKERSEKFFGEK